MDENVKTAAAIENGGLLDDLGQVRERLEIIQSHMEQSLSALSVTLDGMGAAIGMENIPPLESPGQPALKFRTHGEVGDVLERLELMSVGLDKRARGLTELVNIAQRIEVAIRGPQAVATR